ncbi:MAG: hypothetical protein GY947_10155 [Rhodobacteraceae bacterium]|nr:hypothetical protein [Paracoccaceae bacterium]
MTTYYSSDFGWSDGQDISDEFAALAENTLQPGDTLVLESMYQISGENIQLPDDFTLSAVQGAGLDIVDTNAHTDPLILMGDGGKIDNVTFTASESPDTGYEGTHAESGVDFHTQTAVEVKGADNVTISNCDFSGNLEIFLDVHYSDGLVIEGTHFEGSNTQVRMVGDVKDTNISGSHFENALGDGIKTVISGTSGTQRVTIDGCLFEGANRDGIDTTAGFKDSTVSNTVFFGNGVSAMDIKTFIEYASDISPDIKNTGIKVENCEIVDSQNGIVVTMLDQLGVLTAANADELMPHDIEVINTIFENIEKNAFLVKDGYNITWTDLVFLGTFDELRLMNAEAPDGWTAYNVTGTVSTYGVPRNLSAEELWPNDVGPVSGATSGDDILTGTDLAENISLLAGDDSYSALGGNDTVYGDAGDDTLDGGTGNDTIYGNAGNDQIWGGADNDRLKGGSGSDDLFGGADNDKLIGGSGGDQLTGGAGRDVLKGGYDADVFHFISTGDSGTSGATRDLINDFAQGVDSIDLSLIDASVTGAGNEAFSFIGITGFSGIEGELRYKQTATRTIIQGDVDGDGVADFEIGITGFFTLLATDFVL